MTKQQRLELFRRVDVYPVITEKYCAGRTSLDVCQQVLAAGAMIVQLREKDRTKHELYQLAREYRKLTDDYGALFIMNDELDVAMAAAADGVHLGQQDLPVEAACSTAPELLIGASTHNREEALLAEQAGADYINIGPVFSTTTKENVCEALGLDLLLEIANSVQVPYTVMGGIKLDNINEVLQLGARRIAMVTEITEAADIADRIGRLRQFIRQA